MTTAFSLWAWRSALGVLSRTRPSSLVLSPCPSAVLRDALVFAVLAIIADEMSVEVSDRVTLSAGNLPILLAIMFTGRLPAIGVALIVGLWGAWRESSRSVVVYNAANYVVSAFLASLAFDALLSPLGVQSR